MPSAAILRSPYHRLLSTRLMLLSVFGRRTGQRISIPVGYLRCGDEIDVLVGDHEAKSWWRNFEGGTPCRLRVEGRDLYGFGELLDSDDRTDALARYVAAFPAAGRALGITKQGDSGNVLAAAQRVVMLRIRVPDQ